MTEKELPTSNERLLMREDGKPYSPDMELSWQTFLGNRGAMSPAFFEVARIAYIAAWHASLTYAKRSADETTVRIGPADPDNDMVICPTCTSQFRAIPVNVQTKLIDAETFKRSIRIALEMWPEESPEEPDGHDYLQGVHQEGCRKCSALKASGEPT